MFVMDMYHIQKLLFLGWLRDEKGVAVTEMALLFPLLISIMMGVYDLGQGIIVNHKTINASQIIGDLITRNQNLTFAEVEDIVNAGQMAYAPYPSAPMGYDIISVEFDPAGIPVVLWRVTDNMAPNATVLASLADLAEPGEGLVIVSVAYAYVPFFSNFIIDQFDMMEVSFLRGRRSAVVACADC
jgi:Flp pilus assembly protein TadG